MFERIKRIARNASKLNSDKLLKITFNDSEVKEQVIQQQKSQMYDDSVDSEGKALGNYSEASVMIFGKPEGPIRMFDTGKFFASIKVKSETQDVIINANTIKTAFDGSVDLLDRWPNLLGVNEKSLSEIRSFVKPLFIEQVRAELFK